ncbi:MAG TPA: hypothetical protein VNX65_03645 [Patescibacteria group bacterium]|jgi:hypothetical protein|nr:hypothetical protein [Patescibacteria group bacterium]
MQPEDLQSTTAGTPVQPLPILPRPAQAPTAEAPQVGGPALETPPAPLINKNSTQNSLLVSEIRDNLVIMNDGSMRAVITCRSINFDLMSPQERESVEYAYQNFLNSLYFPLQILIRSQKVDIGPYLDRLTKIRRDEDNMLLGVLMDDYINFIDAISRETNIMDKDFYITVPYYPSGDLTSVSNASRNLIINLFAPQTQQRVRIDEATYAKSKDELRNRVQTVVNGLLQLGVHSTQLSTKELGSLYYNVYNPDVAVREPLGDFENLSGVATTKGQGQASQSYLDRETF